MRRLEPREKQILSGLYLSKFSRAGLRSLGFTSFAEAYNVIGFAMGSKPASINNYRDEFDPLFPNGRKGWHKRDIRDYCLKLFEEFKDLDLESFTDLIKSFVGYDENVASSVQIQGEVDGDESRFARRLITGLAAERYFASVQPGLPEFRGYKAQDRTGFGCGYDFRLSADGNGDYLAIEVKGLRGRTGSVLLTPKEYDLAAALKDRFYLFVVKNFREEPFHQMFQDPLSSGLRFAKKEVTMVQVSWLTKV